MLDFADRQYFVSYKYLDLIKNHLLNFDMSHNFLKLIFSAKIRF